jgi:hypothetical protein
VIENFQALPKAEVRIHLEGSLAIDEVVALANVSKVPRPHDKLLSFPA